MLLANHGALTVAHELFAAYYKMETVEHFARISLVARQLGGERLLSREEVTRLQDLRDRYGIAAPAPFCPPDREEGEEGDDVSCQALEAPSQPGARLVEAQTVGTGGGATLGSDAGIRLTYRELTALIADAVKQLR